MHFYRKHFHLELIRSNLTHRGVGLFFKINVEPDSKLHFFCLFLPIENRCSMTLQTGEMCYLMNPSSYVYVWISTISITFVENNKKNHLWHNVTYCFVVLEFYSDVLFSKWSFFIPPPSELIYMACAFNTT